SAQGIGGQVGCRQEMVDVKAIHWYVATLEGNNDLVARHQGGRRRRRIAVEIGEELPVSPQIDAEKGRHVGQTGASFLCGRETAVAGNRATEGIGRTTRSERGPIVGGSRRKFAGCPNGVVEVVVGTHDLDGVLETKIARDVVASVVVEVDSLKIIDIAVTVR